MTVTAVCPECRGVGWLLNENHAGDGNERGPLTLDLLPCIYPPCEAAKAPRPIATLGVRGQFTDVVRHPSTGDVLALTGFTGPVWR